ncbi:putative GPI-anchored protein pfl2 isoform X2 [Eutrema salsugineum]|uniref:putative GPI-anchored protein pfl2 isoform X2 n=1 Tax=Eutrema salsugineum TaxID=72664 RepID=UPI000CED76DA|nr:putative GPI-anchored protein pfl2 isoform X2 [Eutrema salsugineum]
MSDRSLKKSLSGKSNRLVGDADENLDLFSVNRGDLTSFDLLLKPGRHSFEQAKIAKPEADDEKKHGNDPLYTIPEVPLGTLSRLVLEARNVTSKLQSISTIKTGSRSESDPSSKPTRSNSTIRPSNIPTFRPSNIGPTFPTVRSSSAPQKTTTASAPAPASVSFPKRSVSRSLTPVSRKTPSRSSTPSRISTTTTSTNPSFKKGGDAQRSRSLTPRSKPQISANSATPSSSTNVRSTSVSSRPSVSATPRTPPRVKETTVTLAFGRPVVTTNSPKRNTSPDVTRTRPKGHSASSSHTPASPKSVKSTATVADSTRSGRKLSKASVQIANNHLDVSRNGKVGTNPFLSTMLYPHSIRSSSLRNRYCGSSEGSSSSNNQEEEEGKSLTKEGGTEKNDSARYDALLNVKDVKDTNWLLNLDDESNHSLIFDNAFDSPPEPFSPL